MDVAPNGGIVLEEVFHLPSMEWVGGFERLLKVLGARGAPTRLRPGGVVGRYHHLLLAMLLVLVPLIATTLG